MQKLPVRTTLITLASLALAMTCIVAQAADWRPIGSSDTYELSIDAASIQQKGDLREAWSMWNFKQPRPNNDTTFPTLKSYQDMHQYNCKDKTLRMVKEVIYADNNGTGDKRDHSDALKGMTFAKPAANSVAELMMQQVCATDITKKK
jgi:hypothetical protein